MAGPDGLIFVARTCRQLVSRRLRGAAFRLRQAFRGAYIDSGFSIEGAENVFIDRGVVIHRRCEFTARPGAKLIIGGGTRVGSDAVIAVSREVRLGRNVLIAARCYISDHSHAFTDPTRPLMHQGATVAAPVAIGDGAWVGINVAILPGVTLGRNCVVGANSVVTQSVPDHAVVAGVPARIVRQLSVPADPNALL